MTILDLRLGPMLAREPDWLRVPSGPKEDESRSFAGRYVRINDLPFALGRELGRGEEAIVFELIDLRSGQFEFVAKVCRHRPGTDSYRRWAVPIRFQRNMAATNPDIEFIPCHLIPIPGDGVIKVQRYLSPNPAEDWLSRLPLQQAFSNGTEIDAIEASLDELIARHGNRALFLELKGQVAADADRLDEALELLTQALALQVTGGSSSRFVVALSLAQVMSRIYERDRSQGDAEMSITLDDGTVLRNTFFMMPGDAARDDSLQDRSLFVLLEVMGDLPYFVGGLELILWSLHDVALCDAFQSSAKALARIDPKNETLQQLKETGLWNGEDQAKQMPIQHQPTHKPEQEDLPADEPTNLVEHLDAHEEAYNPETIDVRAGAARSSAAMAHAARGNFKEAEADLREAIELEPENAGYRIQLSTFLLSRGRNDESVQTLRHSIEAIGGEPVLRLYLVSALLKCGSVQEANRALLRAKPLLPDWKEQLHLFELEIAEMEKTP